MGDWVYYAASLTMGDIYERVNVADEIHEGSSLGEMIQRELLDKKRAPKIKRYLETQEQRFFNSFVIGVYGGVPDWYEIEIDEMSLPGSKEEIPDRLRGVLGLLVLDGSEALFAIDGQHRVAGIRAAIDSGNKNIENEEVSALFVGHKRNAEGRRRTRRLFTTLNRYADPVNKHEAIALDEDDVVAISTRYIIDEHPLFVDKVALNKTKSIHTSDDKSFTSLVALYDSLDILLRDRSKSDWEEYKKIRPGNENINEIKNTSMHAYNLLCNEFDALSKYADSSIAPEMALDYRNSENGGHLLFRPVGLLLIFKVIRYLMVDSGLLVEEAIERVANVPVQLNQKPWNGLLWDDANKRMTTAQENQRAATRMTLFALRGDLSRFRTMSTESELRKELSGLYNLPEEDVDIPEYV
jgi:DNA sulfur modification protein DndB